jgi:hypothetical protein
MQLSVVIVNQPFRCSCGTNWKKKSIQTPYSVSTTFFFTVVLLTKKENGVEVITPLKGLYIVSL